MPRLTDISPGWIQSPCVKSMLRGGGLTGIKGFFPYSIDFSLLEDGVLPTPWIGATWTIAGGVAKNTPGAGVELWDADAAVFTAGTYSWTAFGANTLANDANTLRITYVNDARGATETLKDSWDLNSDLTVGTFYMLLCDAKVNAGSTCNIQTWPNVPAITGPDLTNINFATQTFKFRSRSAAACSLRPGVTMGAGEIIWVDNLSLKPLTGLIAYFDAKQANVAVKAAWTIPANGYNYHAGVIARSDGTLDNCLLAYHDRGTNIFLLQYVGGAVTSLIDTATAYIGGADIEIRVSGNTAQLFYNDAQVGTDQAVNAALASNTYHGLFATDAACTCASFSCEKKT
jgi:hypothetical protein